MNNFPKVATQWQRSDSNPRPKIKQDMYVQGKCSIKTGWCGGQIVSKPVRISHLVVERRFVEVLRVRRQRLAHHFRPVQRIERINGNSGGTILMLEKRLLAGGIVADAYDDENVLRKIKSCAMKTMLNCYRNQTNSVCIEENT